MSGLDDFGGLPLGVITRAELEEARRDPNVIALHAEADRYLAELERQGLNRLASADPAARGGEPPMPRGEVDRIAGDL